MLPAAHKPPAPCTLAVFVPDGCAILQLRTAFSHCSARRPCTLDCCPGIGRHTVRAGQTDQKLSADCWLLSAALCNKPPDAFPQPHLPALPQPLPSLRRIPAAALQFLPTQF